MTRLRGSADGLDLNYIKIRHNIDIVNYVLSPLEYIDNNRDNNNNDNNELDLVTIVGNNDENAY